ncbi:hypothetical protein R0H17_15705 [Phytobacter diazotrophicus]|uniref:hypothetical protein n=1 Tax=Phytobacter diazotrophicus TaxID=395631 RepID=UPI0029366423|nr:hypothetical protein [Phytobacter diazotrophicus]MDV2903084.1 hypothetical protein [Phytobacter diazotrophicus]
MLESFTLIPLNVVLGVAALCLMRLFYSVDTRSVAMAGSHRKNALAQEHIYRSGDRNMGLTHLTLQP